MSAEKEWVWRVEIVDSNGKVGKHTALDLDRQGNPHISYFDESNRSLKYAYKREGVWHREVVDKGGTYTSLALDSAGRPHIIHIDNFANSIRLARRNALGWEIQPVDAEGPFNFYCSVKVDAQDRVWISYYHDEYPSFWYLKCALWQAAKLTTQIVDSQGRVGKFNELALDSNGLPHISYADVSQNGDLKYARWDGSKWLIQTVDTGGIGYVGIYNSIAVDAAGRPHISYLDATQRLLKYARWNGNGWLIQAVDAMVPEAFGAKTSIALDSQGRPHIGYFSQTRGLVKYAFWNGERWQRWVLDEVGPEGGYVCLRLDARDNPVLSYYDGIGEDLKVAFKIQEPE